MQRPCSRNGCEFQEEKKLAVWLQGAFLMREFGRHEVEEGGGGGDGSHIGSFRPRSRVRF